MKKLFLFYLLNAVALIAFSQINYQWTDNYQVSVGTNKNSAVSGKAGFIINGTDIRIVGFLYRGDKIEYDKLFIEIRRDTIVVDSLIIPCCGISKKWRDFYIKLSNIVYSDNYKVIVYTYDERKYLGARYFYIKKESN
ncbi:MAG: hypothetical protein WCI49_06335 [Ferruginibacter sp.]